jgi:RimJ/RimL family protein N-acetyltransferase
MENNSDSLNLQTVRLEIRNLHMQDLPGFYAYRSNPEVTKYQGFDVMSVEQAKAFIEDNATKKFSKAGEWVQYAIAEKTTGKLVGDCAIRLDQYDTRLGEIGITISPEEQKKGYAKEVLTAILNFLFAIDGFHRLTETVDVENVASIKLLKSVGFREEGHFVENIFFKGKWGSEYQFAMLRAEWEELKQRFL